MDSLHGPVIGFEYFEVAGFVALAEMPVSARLDAVASDRQRHQIDGIVGIPFTAKHSHTAPGRCDRQRRESARLLLCSRTLYRGR